MSAIGPIRASANSRSNWGTPQAVFDKLDAEFLFSLDAAADETNAKLSHYFSGPHLPKDCACALCTSWYAEDAFLNPPYGQGESKCVPKCKKKRCMTRGSHLDYDMPGLDDWVAKCILEASTGSLVVALLPDSLDTKWFREVYRTAWEIRIVEGRIQFDHPVHVHEWDPNYVRADSGKRWCLTCGQVEGVVYPPESDSNTGGSLIVVWRPGVRPYHAPIFSLWTQPERI